jgi:hypothetical protein
MASPTSSNELTQPFTIESESSPNTSSTNNSFDNSFNVNIDNIDDKYKDSPYNKLKYQLPKTDIYIFKAGLFTRSLLLIDFKKNRQIIVKCSLCSYNKVEYITRF